MIVIEHYHLFTEIIHQLMEDLKIIFIIQELTIINLFILQYQQVMEDLEK